MSGEKYTLSSGVEIVVVPFPARLWENINNKALKDFPDPKASMKTIEVVDGTEEVEDLENPEYLKGMKDAESKRSDFLGTAILDFCVQVDLSQYEDEIARIEKYVDDFPTEPNERRVEFLSRSALRTKGDYEFVMVSAITQTTVSDEEIAERLESFQGDLVQETTKGD